MRMLAIKSKEELENEVEKVRTLNSELQDKIAENQVLERQLLQQAMYDNQTGLFNRNPGMETLKRDIEYILACFDVKINSFVQ